MNAQEALARCLKSTATEWGSSRWQEFRACPYGHHLRFVEGVSPRPEALAERDTLDYFAVGQAVHGAMAFAALGALHHFAADWRVPLAQGVAQGVWPAPEVEEARRLVWAYMGTYGAANAGYGSDYRIVDVEPDGWEAKLPAGNDTTLPYTTRPDAVLRRKKTTVLPRGNAGYAYRGRRFVLAEHKTRSRNYGESDEELALLFKTRPQFLGHVYVGREKLGEIPDLLVNLLIKTKIPAYRRIIVRFTDEELDDWATNHVASIANRSFSERWKNYSSCYPEIGSKCWAVSWCHGTAAERKTLYQITRKPSYEPDGEKHDPKKRQAARGQKSVRAR